MDNDIDDEKWYREIIKKKKLGRVDKLVLSNIYQAWYIPKVAMIFDLVLEVERLNKPKKRMVINT